MGVKGLALASTLSIALYAMALAAVWYIRNDAEDLSAVAATTWRSILGGAAAGLAAWGVVTLVVGGTVPGVGASIGALAAAAVVVTVVYAGASRLLGTRAGI